MPARRIVLEQSPFLNPDASLWQRGVWPAQWIQSPDGPASGSRIWLVRVRFDLARPATIRIHVSADERYDLALDGERIGRGPERGDIDHWSFETFELMLSPGPHWLLARCWHLGSGQAPTAQLGVRPAFLLAAEGEHGQRLSTGHGHWECRVLSGYALIPALAADTGARVRITMDAVPWSAWERNDDDEGRWQPAIPLRPAIDQRLCSWWQHQWRLQTATLPGMRDDAIGAGRLRHLATVPEDAVDLTGVVIDPALHLVAEAPAWELLLTGGRLTIPAHTARRAIIDLGAYVCAYASLTIAAGKGTWVRLQWAEALYEPELLPTRWPFDNRAKGHRDSIDGKIFRGQGDDIIASGGEPHLVEGLWWSSGRYLELVVRTADEAVTLGPLQLRETGYPWHVSGRFESDDASLATIEELSLRTLRCCSHETFMDCPYYEQLQYIGDTRLQVLVGYVLSRDDALARKALTLFDVSRFAEGLTCSRYPSRDPQVIPGFSLWWVAMVHDYAWWREDLVTVRRVMPGVRAVLDCFRLHLGADGLVHCPEGWNFLDWVPAWDGGHAPGGRSGSCLQWQLALSLELAAQLEDALGERELCQRHRSFARRLSHRAWEIFYDPASDRLSDDAAHQHFSEHAQVLALLSGCLTPAQETVVARTLVHGQDLSPVTVYFSHYLFEALAHLQRGDLILQRLDLWRGLPQRGLTTVIETPEPTRSDCHAWGAHPVFHFRASLLGVRPTASGFSRLTITPSLGTLAFASAVIPHPRGEITITLAQDHGRLSGHITLPEGCRGVLRWGGIQQPLVAGWQPVAVTAR